MKMLFLFVLMASILLVHGDKKTQRTVHRILGGTFCPIEVVDTLAAAEAKLATETPFLLVVDHELVLQEAGRAVLARQQRQRRAAAFMRAHDDTDRGTAGAAMDRQHRQSAEPIAERRQDLGKPVGAPDQRQTARRMQHAVGGMRLHGAVKTPQHPHGERHGLRVEHSVSEERSGRDIRVFRLTRSQA